MEREEIKKQYEEIYRRYANDVYKVCLYYLKDEEQAKDVVEQAFRSLYEHINEVNPDYILGYLINKVKGVSHNESTENLVSKEVKE